MILLEIVNMMDIISSMAYKFFDKGTGSVVSVNEKVS